MNSAVANVVNRFVPDPAMLEIVDDLTVRFNLGKPQPLFLAALASSYGPFIINPKYVEEHKTNDDPWAHEYYLQGSVGTGPYKLVENNVNERVTMQKYDGYHGGWEGAHFDELIVRVVPEIATRRQLIESGDADATVQNLTPEDYDSLKSNPDVQVVPAQFNRSLVDDDERPAPQDPRGTARLQLCIPVQGSSRRRLQGIDQTDRSDRQHCARL